MTWKSATDPFVFPLKCSSPGESQSAAQSWVASLSLAMTICSIPLRMIEHLVHARPPCAFFAGVERLLARVGERPPLTGDGVGGHLARVGGEILAVVFPIGEQKILRRPQEDGGIADVAGGDAGQHILPDRPLEHFV